MRFQLSRRLKIRVRPDDPPPPPPPDPGGSLVAVSLTNTSGAATPATTFHPFGHAFVQGDVPSSSRLRATWTPSGGSEADVPIQESSVSTWPDGSRRFVACQVRLPAVVGDGSGTLKLHVEAGSPATTLPGGATISSVLADLRANHEFTVSAANLKKGRESITITAGGANYVASTTTLNWIGGTGGTPPTSAQTIFTVVGGSITGVRFKAPEPPYTSPPTLSISSSGIGSGATATYVDSPADGSGSWTWEADTQLAMYGSVDGRGRSRCWALESGPLCVTFAVWGPFTDDTGGASHPHLTVRAYYRCWLDPTTGAIDRVEHFHMLHQGWIEDLAGGSVNADLQRGDFTVKRNGSAVSGLDFTGLRHPVYSAFPLADADADPEFLTGGSVWSSGFPTLFPTFDAAYLCRSNVLPPYEVDFFVGAESLPTTDPNFVSYVPGAHSQSYGRMGSWTINAAGGGIWLGLIPYWSAIAAISQSRNWCESDMHGALYGFGLSMHVLNPSTGRIPSLGETTDSGQLDVAVMGPNRPSSTTFFGAHSTRRSSDFKANVGTPSNFGGGYGHLDYTNVVGAWAASSQLDVSHWPNLAHHAYTRTGAPWFLDQMKVHANHGPMSAGSIRATMLPDDSLVNSRFIWRTQNRSEAWAWRSLAAALALMPDDAVERPYLQHVYDANNAAIVRVVNIDNAEFAKLRALGGWIPPYRQGSTYNGTIISYDVTPFMESYMYLCRAWDYLILGLDDSSDTHAWLLHNLQEMKGRGGGLTGLQECAWGGTAYETTYGTPTTGWFADWSMVPDTHVLAACEFHSDGRITGNADGTNGDISKDSGGNPYIPGDRIFFMRGSTASLGSVPPPEINEGQYYHMATVDSSDGGGTPRTITISPNSDLSSPIGSFTPTLGVHAAVRRSTCPVMTSSSQTAKASSRKFAEINPEADIAFFWACAQLAIRIGHATSADQWVVNATARLAMCETYRWPGTGGRWRADPRTRMAAN